MIGIGVGLPFDQPPKSPSIPPALPLVYDSFNRDDNAESLGTADTGQAWTAINGVWGINSNCAKVVTDSGARNIAVVDSGAADGNVQVTCVDIPSLYGGLAFRVVDINNYIRFTRYSSTQYEVRKYVENVSTVVKMYTVTPAAGDVLKVMLEGSTITPHINGVALESVEIAEFAAATKHGLMTDNSINPRYDDFLVQV